MDAGRLAMTRGMLNEGREQKDSEGVEMRRERQWWLSEREER